MPADYWLDLGGAATLRSYGADSAQALPAEHVDWLRSLRSSYDDGRRFFVHAGIDPENRSMRSASMTYSGSENRFSPTSATTPASSCTVTRRSRAARRICAATG